MTNAAEASVALPDRPPITLRLLASEKSLIIEAWDHSPRDLEPREPDADDEYGRGLTVVAALSDRWGWQRTGHHRKVVWPNSPSERTRRVSRGPGRTCDGSDRPRLRIHP